MTPARPTTERLGREVDAAQTALAQLGGALFELDAARERLAATASGLTGASAARWKESATQLQVLWSWYQAGSESVTALAEARQAAKLRPAELQAMWDRLTGPSVELPADTVDTGRSCLPGAAGLGPKASIPLLIEVLKAGYEQAAEPVAEVRAVHEMVLPRLDELDEQLRGFEERAGSVGIHLPNAAHRVKRAIENLRNQISVDPLAANVSEIPSLVADLQEVKAAVENRMAAIGAAAEGFERLEGELEKAAADVSAIRPRMTEVAEKIAGPAPVPDDVTPLEHELRGLQSQLADALSTAEGDRAAGERELRALTPRVSALATEASALLQIVSAPLAHRQELRGRLGAYRAKAHAMGRAEEFGLEQLYRAAQDALYTAPCDLGAAEKRLAAYQTAIVQPPVEDRLS